MAKYLTKNLSKPSRGIDLKSSELNRTQDYLTNAQNMMYDQNGDLCKRNGFHTRIYGIDAVSGLTRFDTTDYKGVSKSELLLLGSSATSSPVKVVKNTFSITNTLIAGSVTFTVLYDEATLQYRLVISGTVAADIALGLGVGDLTLAGLIAALPLTQTGVASGVDTIPAAYLEMKQITLQPGEIAVFEYYTTAELVWGGAGAEPTFSPGSVRVNPSIATVNGSIYWYADDEKLYKYDGHVWYEAGLNRSSQTISHDSRVATGTTVTDVKGTYAIYYPVAYNDDEVNKYCYRLMYKDKVGASHVGEMGVTYSGTPSSANANGGTPIFIFNPFTNTSNTIKGVNVGTNARCAIADGPNNDDVTTIKVHAGHTLIPGDIAYFWRKIGSGGFFIERLIESVTATSITISTDFLTDLDSTATVDLYDNAIISNNFRIEYFYANEFDTDGNVFSADIVAAVPFNSLRTNGVEFHDIYVNTKQDTTEYYRYAYGTYSFPGALQYPPPSGKFIAPGTNGSSLISSGDSEADNTVYSSTQEDCEAFYIGRNSFTVDERVSGLGSSGSVSIVGTTNRVYSVVGDIPALNFRVEKITDNMGIESNSSIVSIDEGTICFNTHKGVFSLTGGRELAPVGAWPSDKRISIIEPFFTYRYPTTGYAPRFDLAKVSVIKEKKLIINMVPSYFGTSFYGADTVTWVYDYSMGGWFVWTGIDASLGAAYWDEKVWIASQGAGGTVNLNTMNETNTDYDYSDHGTAIEAVVQYAWENAGAPNLYKKFLWMTAYTPSGNGLPYEMNVRTWANYEINKVQCFTSPTALHTEFYKYATPPGYTMEAKLKSGKLCSLMLEIGNNNANEGLWIAGTELDIAPIYATPSRSGRSDA